MAPHLAGGVGGLLVVGWAGLHVTPAPLPPPAVEAADVTTTPLPDDLPEPVARFYQRLYGDTVPVVESAVLSGRGRMRVAGLTFPARFRFSHVAGHDYRHYIELTAYGQRVVSVDEWFVDGRARLELPMGVSEGPQVDQGANLALWAEAMAMPSVWITDSRAAWSPIDDASAHLQVPFGDEVETFTVHFDPATGLLRRMASMRFKGETDEARTPWVNEVVEWGELDGQLVPRRMTVRWGDEARPWADLHIEDVLHTSDLGDYLRRSGP